MEKSERATSAGSILGDLETQEQFGEGGSWGRKNSKRAWKKFGRRKVFSLVWTFSRPHELPWSPRAAWNRLNRLWRTPVCFVQKAVAQIIARATKLCITHYIYFFIHHGDSKARNLCPQFSGLASVSQKTRKLLGPGNRPAKLPRRLSGVSQSTRKILSLRNTLFSPVNFTGTHYLPKTLFGSVLLVLA